MFGWLKQKAIGAVQNQCRFNIKLTAKTLISIADEADRTIQSTGDSTDLQKSKVADSQKRLLEELYLAQSNGIIKSDLVVLIEDILNESATTNGAHMATKHVLETLLEGN